MVGSRQCARCLTSQNDILGQVDNAHLANSDNHTPFNKKCLTLSEIHSVRLFDEQS
jgi:hypothetical protein